MPCAVAIAIVENIYLSSLFNKIAEEQRCALGTFSGHCHCMLSAGGDFFYVIKYVVEQYRAA